MARVDEAVLDRVRAGMRGLRPPGHHDKVYKEECMYSFDTPYSPGGLYVNLKTFQVRQACRAACMLWAACPPTDPNQRGPAAAAHMLHACMLPRRPPVPHNDRPP